MSSQNEYVTHVDLLQLQAAITTSIVDEFAKLRAELVSKNDFREYKEYQEKDYKRLERKYDQMASVLKHLEDGYQQIAIRAYSLAATVGLFSSVIIYIIARMFGQ